MKIVLLVVAFLGLSALVSAQTIDSYTLRTFNVGAPSPLQTFPFLSTATVCNQTPPAPGTPTVNPTRVIWDDTANVGKVCIWTDAGTGPLFSVPTPGNYEGTVSATNAGGTGPESSRAPFSRLAVPAVQTGLRIVR